MIFYKKLFKFSFFFVSKNNIKSIFKIIFSFFKIFSFLNFIKSFGFFLPNNFNIINSKAYSFWIKGFITNFNELKWFLVHIFVFKKLPYTLINLTNNVDISWEINIRKIPLINFFSKNIMFNDYFLTKRFHFVYTDVDFIFFFIFIFNYIKTYKNV